MLRTPTGLDQWSAPETRHGGEYTESVDYWGIGVILYFLVTFRPPFIDANELRLL
jgi:serine/threonine protein kinase